MRGRSRRKWRVQATTLAVVATLTTAAACGGAPSTRVPSTRVATGERARADAASRTTPAPAAALTQGEVTVRLFPATDAALLTFGTERDGRTRASLGGLRMLVANDGAVELARDSFAADLAAAAEIPSGWAFAARDGTLAVSPTFLGSLSRLRDLHSTLETTSAESATRGRGRLVVSTRMGAWATDGSGPATRVMLGHGLRAAAAAFGDRDRGVAIDTLGSLHATVNGGRSWSPIADAYGFDELEVDGDDIIASGPTVGRHKVARDLTLSPASPRAAATDITRVRELVRAHLRLQLGSGDESDDRVTLADGREVRISADGHWIGPDGQRGPLVEVGRLPGEQALARARGRCRLARRADAVVVVCPGIVLETTDGVTLQPRSIEAGIGATFVSSDGSAAAWLGSRCGGRELGPYACVVRLSDGHATSIEDTLLTGALGERMEGDRLVAQCGVPRSACVVSPEGVSVLAAVLGDEALLATNADILTGGRIIGSAATDRGLLFLLRWDPGHDVDVLVAPPGVVRTAFVDQNRGIAIGATVGQVYRTLDGGDHWRRLALNTEGRSDAARLTGNAWCNETACGVGTRLRIEQPFAASIGAERVISRTGPSNRRSDDDDDDDALEWLTVDPRDEFECRTPPSRRDEDDEEDDEEEGTPMQSFDGGQARVSAVDARRTRIEWIVEGLNRSVVVPATALGEPERMRSGWRPVVTATPSGVLIVRAVEQQAWTWWPTRGAPIQITLPPAAPGTTRTSTDRPTARVIPLRNGGLILLLDDREMGTLIRIDARGVIREQRALRAAAVIGVVERNGNLSLLISHSRDPSYGSPSDLAVVPLDAGGPDVLREPRGEVSICGRASGDTWIRTRSRSLSLELEQTGDAGCVRAVATRTISLRSDGRALRSASGTTCTP